MPERYENRGPRDSEVSHGDPIDGYQLVSYQENGSLVYAYRRAPPTADYSTTNLNLLTSHQNAHTLDRHGPDISDEALIRRANEGIAPDGSTRGGPRPDGTYFSPIMSSRFDSPQELQAALRHTREGTEAFANGIVNPNNPNRMTVTYSSTDGRTFGSGVARGTTELTPLHSVTAQYENVDGVWQLVTMHPS